MPEANLKVLSAHHVAHAVLNVLEEAREHVVLVTAYLRPWIHLEQAVKEAVERGVKVACIIRDPDGPKRDQEKAKEAIETLKKLRASVHIVPRLHAKVYLNESQAVVTSFNLVGGSHDSVEFGVRIGDPEVVKECYERLASYCPELKSGSTVKHSESRAAARPTKVGFCVGCGSDSQGYDPAKPLCRDCYKESRRGTACDVLPKRVCHSCGAAHKASLEKPLCYDCFKQLSSAERDSLAGGA
jgi:PLD-like domain